MGRNTNVGLGALLALLPCLLFETGCSGGDYYDGEESIATDQAPLDVSRFNGWGGPLSGDTNFISGPAYTRTNDQEKLLFALRSDNRIVWNTWWQGNGVWSGWSQINTSNTVASRPSAAPYTDNQGTRRMAVASLDFDGSIFIAAHRAQQGSHGAWTGWQDIPGSAGFQGSPLLLANGNTLYAFGWKPNGRYYFSTGEIASGLPGFWSAWAELPGGGIFTSEPAAVVSPSGSRITVVGRGNDLRYWVATGTAPNTLRGWRGMGSRKYAGPPALTSFADRQVDVYGTQNGQRTFCVSTIDPVIPESIVACPVIGSGLFSSPPAAFGSATTFDVFGRGLDNGIYINTWD